MIELLRPEQAGKRLAHHHLRVGIQPLWYDSGIELVGFRLTISHHLVASRKRVGADVDRGHVGQPQFERHFPMRRNHAGIVGRRLGADARWVERLHVAVDYRSVDAVLEVARRRPPEEPLGIRVVLREEQRGRAAVDDDDPYEQVLGSSLGVLDEDVEVGVLRKRSRLDKLELAFVAGTPAVLGHDLVVREGLLRVLVEVSKVGRGCLPAPSARTTAP